VSLQLRVNFEEIYEVLNCKGRREFLQFYFSKFTQTSSLFPQAQKLCLYI